jgi:hypothetical protein
MVPSTSLPCAAGPARSEAERYQQKMPLGVLVVAGRARGVTVMAAQRVFFFIVVEEHMQVADKGQHGHQERSSEANKEDPFQHPRKINKEHLKILLYPR